VESRAIKSLPVPELAIWGSTEMLDWPEDAESLNLKVNRMVDWEIRCDTGVELYQPGKHGHARRDGMGSCNSNEIGMECTFFGALKHHWQANTQ
jgi:hypothetical protein